MSCSNPYTQWFQRGSVSDLCLKVGLIITGSAVLVGGLVVGLVYLIPSSSHSSSPSKKTLVINEPSVKISPHVYSCNVTISGSEEFLNSSIKCKLGLTYNGGTLWYYKFVGTTFSEFAKFGANLLAGLNELSYEVSHVGNNYTAICDGQENSLPFICNSNDTKKTCKALSDDVTTIQTSLLTLSSVAYSSLLNSQIQKYGTMIVYGNESGSLPNSFMNERNSDANSSLLGVIVRSLVEHDICDT